MPRYCYRKENGDLIELTMTFEQHDKRERKDGTILLGDGYVAKRDFVAEHFEIRERGEWPRASDAMGVLPEQAGEAYANSVRLGCPTEFSKETGCAVFKSPRHQKAYVKAVGGIDYGSYDS